MEFGGVGLYIDLGAEDLIGAERDGRKIAVEVKSFIGASTISEFHTAVGQFVNYRVVLDETDPERVLYLAVPESVFASLFETQFGKLAVQANQLRVAVFDDQQEAIMRWID